MKTIEEFRVLAAGNSAFQEAVDEIETWRYRGDRYDLATAMACYVQSQKHNNVDGIMTELHRITLEAAKESV